MPQASVSPPCEWCAILALDLAFYLCHVAMHEVPVFWRCHRVRHSDPTVDVTTSIRQHPAHGGLHGTASGDSIDSAKEGGLSGIIQPGG